MLIVENATVSYPNGVVAIDAIRTRFSAGQFVVLLGPSGAGKSTLLRCLNGLIEPTRGDVKVEGLGSIFQSRRALREHRRRTGMIFQQHHLIGRLTALQNVLLGRLGHQHPRGSILPFSRADRLSALAALDRVGLIDRALERADRLSGGQQQRVGIARAMAQQPTIFSPTSRSPVWILRVRKRFSAICAASARKTASRRSSACIRSISPGRSPITSSDSSAGGSFSNARRRCSNWRLSINSMEARGREPPWPPNRSKACQ